MYSSWVRIKVQEENAGIEPASLVRQFWTYNFCLIHRSLRMTPAMAAGITDHIGDLEDIIS